MNATDSQCHDHVYDRAAISGADDAPGRILARIRPETRVLDIGTGAGGLGRSLKAEKRCVVDGLTYSAAELAEAEPHYRRIQLLDLEDRRASEAFGTETYDYVVCADVLEHLRNADQVLADLATLLAPGGRILVSVPNVTYVGVIVSLLAGHLVRTREGLLDSTHVRFFDRRGLDELATAARLKVLSVERVLRNPGETEFRYLDFEALPPAVADYLRGLPEALTYEYVVELAAPADAEEAIPPLPDYPEYAEVDAVPHFQAQAFFDAGAGFSEQGSVCAYGRLDGGRVELRFALPLSAKSALRGLLIDFADRPGTFELFNVRLEDASARHLWQWAGDWSAELIFRDLEALPAHGAFGGRLMRSTSRQPRMQIGFAQPLMQAAVLVVEMTAPQRYEALAFEQAQRSVADTVRALRDAMANADDGNRAMQARLDAAHDDIRSLHQRLHSSAEENLSLHRLLQSAADEKQALIQAQKTADTLLEDERRAAQRQMEQIARLESRIASPFRLAAARVRWLLRRLLGNDGS